MSSEKRMNKYIQAYHEPKLCDTFDRITNYTILESVFG
jgi:hypothetical protein